jgi:hypothetical protein
MAREEKQDLNKTLGEKLNVACAECNRKTKHVVLASVDQTGSDTHAGRYHVSWGISYQVIQCLGCETVSFRKASHDSESSYELVAEDEWEFRPDEELYPGRLAGRAGLVDVGLLPDNVQRIYLEAVKALNSQQPILTGIGLRALIEAVCKEKGAVGSDLFAKIDNLVALGVLTAEGAKVLHKLRALGNEAAHEVKPHSDEHLGVAMDVVEHLLQGTYILPHHAGRTFK